MDFGGVKSFDNKIQITFIAATKNVNAEVYQRLGAHHVIPWVQRSNPDGGLVF